MKLKLLRSTMIAGVPTDSGSLVDVEQHTGEYLINVGKAELVVETCEAPTPSTEPVVEQEPTDSDEVDFSQMTKAQLEVYGRQLGLELDKRHNKADLIVELEEAISIMEET
tara:strand:+ start:486 stop:818 length:333 start_codon:yes stop_codon:yes gene_type:complete